jgi:hypothetical protein
LAYLEVGVAAGSVVGAAALTGEGIALSAGGTAAAGVIGGGVAGFGMGGAQGFANTGTARGAWAGAWHGAIAGGAGGLVGAGAGLGAGALGVTCQNLGTGAASVLQGAITGGAGGFAGGFVQGGLDTGTLAGAWQEGLTGAWTGAAIGGGIGAFLQNACFAAGTPILLAEQVTLADGSRAAVAAGSELAERISKGDVLLSRNESDPTAPLAAKVVEEVFVRAGVIFLIHLGGRVIRTTPEHEMFVRGKGKIAAAELEPGDLLPSHTGGWTPVEMTENTGKVETVYNFRVADYHTYFVGSAEWGFSVWVHNVYSVKGQGEFFEDALYTPDAALMEPGGLRSAALEAHEMLNNEIAQENSAVALAEVELAGGKTEIWGSGSRGKLTPDQRNYLLKLGVRLFGGGNHAEINIINNMPEGASVNRWGISWGQGSNGTSWCFPCGDCAPAVVNVRGPGLLELFPSK